MAGKKSKWRKIEIFRKLRETLEIKKQLMCSDDTAWLTSWERVSSRKGWIWRRGWGRGQGRTGPTALCGFFPKVVNKFTNGALFTEPTRFLLHLSDFCYTLYSFIYLGVLISQKIENSFKVPGCLDKIFFHNFQSTGSPTIFHQIFTYYTSKKAPIRISSVLLKLYLFFYLFSQPVILDIVLYTLNTFFTGHPSKNLAKKNMSYFQINRGLFCCIAYTFDEKFLEKQ